MQGRDPYGVALAAITLVCLACLAMLIPHMLYAIVQMIFGDNAPKAAIIISMIALLAAAQYHTQVKAWVVAHLEEFKEELEATRREERESEVSRRALQGDFIDEVRLALREWRRRNRIPTDVDTHIYFNLVMDRLPNDPPARPVLRHYLNGQAVDIEADDQDLKGYIRELSLLHVPEDLRKIDTLKMKG
ncbi:hypothetical protein KUV57_13755 [Epibacterium sp. DP7N7-1]|nr:hypothetical protein [Epibacterium sp. DP7N7-1]